MLSFLQARFPPCNEKYCLKWLKTHSLCRFYWSPMEKKVKLALLFAWCKQNGDAFYSEKPQESTERKGGAVISVSQSEEDPEKMTALMSPKPLFSEMCLKMLIYCLWKAKGAPHVPLPQVLFISEFWQPGAKILNGRKIDFPQCQTKGDFLFFFSQNRIYKPLSITSRILPELSRERNQCGNSIPLGNVKWQQVGPSTICPTLNIK